jgi:hypothetical protein
VPYSAQPARRVLLAVNLYEAQLHTADSITTTAVLRSAALLAGIIQPRPPPQQSGVSMTRCNLAPLLERHLQM